MMVKLTCYFGGNEYQVEIGSGQYDASYGQFLKNDGKGGFINVLPVESGFIADGDLKSLKEVTTKNNERLIFAAVNDNLLRCFKINTGRPTRK